MHKKKRKKKSAPREKWKQSVFNIPYFSFSALPPRLTFPSVSSASQCMQRLSNIVFISYYSKNSPGPCSSPPQPRFCPLPPSLPFYLLRLGEADAVISQAFNSLSHPLAAAFFKKLSSRLPRWMHSLRFLIPAGRRSRRCQTWTTAVGGEKERDGKMEETNTRVRMMEGRRNNMSGRLSGAAAIRLLFIFSFCFQS